LFIFLKDLKCLKLQFKIIKSLLSDSLKMII